MAKFNQENSQGPIKFIPMKRKVTYGILLAVIFFIAAFGIGLIQGKAALALSLIGTSIVLEAQPAAVLSVPLGFGPLTGGLSAHISAWRLVFCFVGPRFAYSSVLCVA